MKTSDPLRSAIGGVLLFAIVSCIRYDNPVRLTGMLDTAILIAAMASAVIGSAVMLINETPQVSISAFVCTGVLVLYQLMHGFAPNGAPVPLPVTLLVFVMPLVFGLDLVHTMRRSTRPHAPHP